MIDELQDETAEGFAQIGADALRRRPVANVAMRDRVAEKILRVRVSPKFDAIIDCLLDLPARTAPVLVRLLVTSDGFLLGMREGHIGYNDFLGDVADLERNLGGLADVADLTPEETAWLGGLVTALRLPSYSGR